MSGTNANTGAVMGGIEHLWQSIGDLLTTPIGSRVILRDYGSEIFEQIDQPDNGATRVRIYNAAATALMRWEKRVKVSRLSLVRGKQPGQVELTIDGDYLGEDGNAVPVALSLTIPLGQAA
jgi:phage baseplate assembly protein W